MRFVFIAILMAFSTQASAQEMSYGDLKTLRVFVVLDDQAKDACWTNLTESREYAEEKLRSAGATVSSYIADAGDYALVLKVRSYRNNALRLCYGYLSVNLATSIMMNGKPHDAYLYGYEAIFMGKQNINNEFIESIQYFFEVLKDR
jgi:hypothetical protein